MMRLGPAPLTIAAPGRLASEGFMSTSDLPGFSPPHKGNDSFHLVQFYRAGKTARELREALENGRLEDEGWRRARMACCFGPT
jgi:hypothetical protein